MRLRGLTYTFLVLVIVLWPAWFPAQAQSTPAASASPVTANFSEQQRYPDEGFLSDSRYTSEYFGFGFDLPADAHLQPVHRPVAPDGHFQLLDVDGPPPQHAEIQITAYLKRDKSDVDAKRMLRRELDTELFYGVEELRGLSKTTIAKHQFFCYHTRRGIDEHVLLATDLDGYVLHVVLAAHDERLVKQLETSFAAITFFDPSQARQYAGASAKPYEGPALSAHRLAMLKADPPASHINAGKVAGNEYENAEIGLSYPLPSGWLIGTQPALEAAIERTKAQSSLDIDGMGASRPWMGTAERELVKACKRILFSAWKERPGANGNVTYDDFGEITLSIMSLACFPDMKFPASPSDTATVQNFLVQFSLTHPLLRQMREGKAFESAGKVFVLTEGVVAFQTDGEQLSRRLSIAMATTEHSGYLLTWFFAAPHDSELRDLMNAKMTLTPEPLPNRSKSEELAGGGGVPASTGEQPPVAPDTAAATTGAARPAGAGDASTPSVHPASPVTTASNAGPQSAGSGSESSATPAAAHPPQPDAGAQASQRPTLLRPGETMQDQQMNGTPVPKKR